MTRTISNIDNALSNTGNNLYDEQSVASVEPKRRPAKHCRRRRFKRRMRKIYGFITVLLLFISTFTAQYSSSAKPVDRDTVTAFVEGRVGEPVLDDVLDELEQSAAVEEENNALWLARVIYSETNRPDEQELVAWVVRNRVELQYRGNASYKEAVLDPYQFSAFNPGSPVRARYLALDENSDAPGWQTALTIARHVLQAPPDERPFAQDTWHFYSEVSMVGGRKPAWAHGETPVGVDDRDVEVKRFRFYKGIA